MVCGQSASGKEGGRRGPCRPHVSRRSVPCLVARSSGMEPSVGHSVFLGQGRTAQAREERVDAGPYGVERHLAPWRPPSAVEQDDPWLAPPVAVIQSQVLVPALLRCTDEPLRSREKGPPRAVYNAASSFAGRPGASGQSTDRSCEPVEQEATSPLEKGAITRSPSSLMLPACVIEQRPCTPLGARPDGKRTCRYPARYNSWTLHRSRIADWWAGPGSGARAVGSSMADAS
ncbi:hypothetical protein SAMN05192530_11093 [Aureimonas jatrophae]|uniref:Uncharacterized protein n=1 Tax=Aureimonas jatrophae TaxID=1166073 RepID=A0A1H0LMI7_9HYPH|nr:hypothetical protein SAMN05192530_11093 [Aureimonas jatrophae]